MSIKINAPTPEKIAERAKNYRFLWRVEIFVGILMFAVFGVFLYLFFIDVENHELTALAHRKSEAVIALVVLYVLLVPIEMIRGLFSPGPDGEIGAHEYRMLERWSAQYSDVATAVKEACETTGFVTKSVYYEIDGDVARKHSDDLKRMDAEEQAESRRKVCEAVRY